VRRQFRTVRGPGSQSAAVSYCSLSVCSILRGLTMFSVGNPERGSGKDLLSLVDAACSLMEISLQVGLVQIIRQLEGTACTSLCSLRGGASILWLMDLGINTLLTTQGLGHHWLGSFQLWLMQYNRYRNSTQFLKVHLLPNALL
jgi:hypothetical protein